MLSSNPYWFRVAQLSNARGCNTRRTTGRSLMLTGRERRQCSSLGCARNFSGISETGAAFGSEARQNRATAAGRIAGGVQSTLFEGAGVGFNCRLQLF